MLLVSDVDVLLHFSTAMPSVTKDEDGQAESCLMKSNPTTVSHPEYEDESHHEKTCFFLYMQI